MIIIGITGSFGTGKSTVARMFGQEGARVIDADALVHQHLMPNGKVYPKVVRAFGREILQGKEIDRRKLAAIVFNNKAQLKKLTSIVHPVILREVQAYIRRYKKDPKNRMVVVDAPLLIEAGWHRWVDYLVVVKVSRKLQLERIMARTGMPRSEALERIRSQMPLRNKITMADIAIDNRKSLKETHKQVHMIAQRLLARAQ